jgi:HEAT repeat protein
MVSTSLPQIAELANYDPTSRRERRTRLILKLPAPVRNCRLILPLWDPRSPKDPILFRDNRDKYASAAIEAICIAGPAATNAVPMLLDLVRTNGPACSQRAVRALNIITLETVTVPILTNLALNPLAGPMRRRIAIQELKRYTNDPAAFAFLTNTLQDPDRQIQAAAAEVLAPLLYQ